MSPSSRRAWIEISGTSNCWIKSSSPSSRRAWIEIPLCLKGSRLDAVALLAEGVDRNFVSCEVRRLRTSVALLAEGVDRNERLPEGQGLRLQSPSSRRAWIEITPRPATPRPTPVALLAEGVERNTNGCRDWMRASVALLAEGVDRNSLGNPCSSPHRVALLAEGVDRNQSITMDNGSEFGRPPRGGRG